MSKMLLFNLISTINTQNYCIREVLTIKDNSKIKQKNVKKTSILHIVKKKLKLIFLIQQLQDDDQILTQTKKYMSNTVGLNPLSFC